MYPYIAYKFRSDIFAQEKLQKWRIKHVLRKLCLLLCHRQLTYKRVCRIAATGSTKKSPCSRKPRGGVAGAVPRTGGRRVSGVAFLLASLFVYDEYAMPARLFTRGTRVQYAAPDSAVGGIRPLTMDPNHLAMAAPPASTASPIRTSTCSLVKLTLALRSDFADEILMEEERKPSPMASS